MNEQTFSCEFLLAHDDYTWEPRLFELPISLEDRKDDELESWWMEVFGCRDSFRTVVMAKVYNRNVEVVNEMLRL